MTPAARLSAAIDVLDHILAGQNAEQVLTNWGRSNRFAGSGDRSALRDLVFDALRCKLSFAALGGGLSGRGLVLGGARAAGLDIAALFTGIGHAPAVPGPDDDGAPAQGLAALDCPDWLETPLRDSLGPDFEAVMRAMQHRAPVFLRVNAAKTSVAAAVQSLRDAGILVRPNPNVKNALEVTENARKIRTSAAYLHGLVELQDLSSQAVVAALPLTDGMRVLDFCAGGGGKTLAMAARARLRLFAYDANPARLSDLPARAARACVDVTIVKNPADAAPYELILTDVPCSGSGSWRRDSQGKWALNRSRLDQIKAVQAEILDSAAGMVAKGGTLAYATCSLLAEENDAQISAFLARSPGWAQRFCHQFSPLHGGDGFFVALLTRLESTSTQPQDVFWPGRN